MCTWEMVAGEMRWHAALSGNVPRSVGRSVGGRHARAPWWARWRPLARDSRRRLAAKVAATEIEEVVLLLLPHARAPGSVLAPQLATDLC